MARTAIRPPSQRLLVGASLAPLAVAATSAAAAPAASAVTRRSLLGALAGRCVLRPLDQLFRADRVTILVLLDQLQADPSARLVDLLHEHVQDVPAVDHVLDVADPSRADVRDVQQSVGALLQLDERAELLG